MHGLGVRFIEGFNDGADGSGRRRLNHKGARLRFRKVHVQVDFRFVPGGPDVGRRGDFTDFRIGGGAGSVEKGAVRVSIVQPDFLVRRLRRDDEPFLVVRMVEFIA